MADGGTGAGFSSLNPMMAPRSVAVIGASDDPTRIGGRPLSYMIARGFAGPVWPVNPRRDRVQGPEQGHAVGPGVHAGVRHLGALRLDVQALEHVHLVLVPGVDGTDREAHAVTLAGPACRARARMPVR